MLQRQRFVSLEEYDSFCSKLSEILYDPTKLSISTGDDAVLDDIFSYQIYNLNKDNWRASLRPTDAQSGMVMSDLDDDKLYHRGAALADEEILQLIRSNDVSPQFATMRIMDTGVDHYLDLKCNENLTAHRLLNIILNDAARILTIDTDFIVGSHNTRHQNGGGDEINVAGLSGELADNQLPKTHKASHENVGGDEINVAGLSGLLADDQHVLDAEVVTAAKTVKLDDFAAPDDNTDLNVLITKHGLCPKLDNDPTHYLNGQGAYTTPAGGGASFPEGMITAWIGGYFTNGANAGYTRVLGSANTIAAVNTLLNASGWYVCDGAALNLGTSTIFNGAGRYLPNLTDDRFIMGDNAAGSSGGSSTMAHTHGIGSYVAANESAHTHAKGSIATGNESSHTHGIGTLGTANESSHTHAKGSLGPTGNESSHTHAKGSYAVGSHRHIIPVSAVGPSNLIYIGDFLGDGLQSRYADNHTRFTCSSHTDHGAGTHNWCVSEYITPSFSGTSAAGSAHNHSITGSTAAGSAHSHNVTGAPGAGTAHNHSVSGSTAAGSAHNHSLSGTSAAASNTENRPKFLSTFFLMYCLS